MKIDHIAIWTKNLEGLKTFYMKYFGAKPNQKYYNPKKKFSSYFLSFDEGCTLEIMEMPGVRDSKDDPYQQFTGLIHFAINVGSKNEVDRLTVVLKTDGFVVASDPLTTGDGCYESVILDPDGNRVEIIA